MLLKDHTTGQDIFKVLKKVMELNNLCFKNLASVATDKAPCMISQYNGLVAFLKNQDGIDKNAFINYH